jgi:RNA polymerase sigma-70 factor (ECF subfamily)
MGPSVDRGAERVGSGQSGKATAPIALPVRVEERVLEIDWSQIVRRCMDGDSGAWAELVRVHHKRVYGLCYRFTGNPTDAEDMTQDVFLKIYTNLSSFDTGRGSLQVWIATMTRNLLVDNFRRTKNLRATGSLDEGWESVEELKPVDRLTARGPSPHESAAQKELARWYRVRWRGFRWTFARR